jgi:hypothetical protein
MVGHCSWQVDYLGEKLAAIGHLKLSFIAAHSNNARRSHSSFEFCRHPGQQLKEMPPITIFAHWRWGPRAVT